MPRHKNKIQSVRMYHYASRTKSGRSVGRQADICPTMAEITGAGEGKRQRVIRKLRNRYRLLLINDSNFEERFSIRLSRLNVLLIGLATLALYGTIIVAVIVFTPLKRHIPGYSDHAVKLNAYRSAMKADSLGTRLRVQEMYVNNLRAVLSGDLPVDSTTLFDPVEKKPTLQDLQPGAADSSLRAKRAIADAYSLTGPANNDHRELAGIFLFTPLRGIVTSRFDRAQGHFGIDIVSRADAAVKSCLDGTVTLSSWTSDGGHVLHIQHPNDLVSVYKHNSVLLKKTGDRVAAGEAVAIVGNSGELTTGPHLHFELWLQGNPVDPQAYMVFE